MITLLVKKTASRRASTWQIPSQEGGGIERQRSIPPSRNSNLFHGTL